jgi:hypothetical protein
LPRSPEGFAGAGQNILTAYIRCATIQKWPTESSSIGMPRTRNTWRPIR